MEEVVSKASMQKMPDYEKVLDGLTKPEGMTDKQWSIIQASIMKKLENEMIGSELTN